MRLPLLVATLLGSACEVSYVEPGSEPAAPAKPVDTPPEATPEVIALRDDVLAATVPLTDRPQYTPKDPKIYPTLVDPAIAYVLKQNPDAPRDVQVREAARYLASAFLREPAGITALELTITARYNDPVVTRDGDLVRVDLGLIAGTPSIFRGGLAIASPHAENGSHGLVAPEVIRNLNTAMKAHPDAKTYQVEVEIPSRWRTREGFTYLYDRTEDRIRFYQEERTDVYWRTGVLNGTFDGIERLVWSTMEQMPMDRAPVRSKDLAK